MESIKVLAMVEEAGVHDLKRRELIKYVLKLRKFVLKQNDKIVYQKGKISQLVSAESVVHRSACEMTIEFIFFPLQKDKLKSLSLSNTTAAADPVKQESDSDEAADEKGPDKATSSPAKKENDPESFIDDIKSAAEAQSLKNGFIYEPTSGLYYDTSTGYYYNAEYGLYYDGSTGKYYSYDQTTKEFTYHSTVAVQESPVPVGDDEPTGEVTAKKRKVRRVEKKAKQEKSTEDLEDGEISSEDSYVECSSEEEHIYEDISKHYPPSLRLVVQQSTLDKLRVGSLFLVTCKGGSLGREGEHDVVIPDINVSKCHLKFSYDEVDACYKCQDQGSRNGTILNGIRMSEATEESALVDIPHGSVIQVSDTKLLCHVHPGTATCGYCEPGLLMQMDKGTSERVESTSASGSHKAQLKQLQRKYGLEKESE